MSNRKLSMVVAVVFVLLCGVILLASVNMARNGGFMTIGDRNAHLREEPKTLKEKVDEVRESWQ